MEHQNYKKQLIIFLAALLFMLAAGITAFYRYLQRLDQNPKRHAERTNEPIMIPVAHYGESFFLKPFRIGLAGPGRPYVQLEIVIEHRKSDDLRRELERREPQLREIILFAVQRKDKAFFLTPEGKDALRDEVRIAINRVMRRKIDEIHIPALFVYDRRVEPGMRI